MTGSVDIVVPTLGRASLPALLEALATGRGPLPRRIVLVCDGPADLPEIRPRLLGRTTVLPGPGRGPAAARNVGWRASRAMWIAFLDDDVVPASDWRERLVDDLDGLPADVAASQGQVRVPLPRDRRPTDWERNVKGLEQAAWATADMAVRRAALEKVGGFDERFRRAYREDADLALRMIRAGYCLVPGGRAVTHPVREERALVSLRLQAGNADDALMDALHGRDWYERAGAPRGRRPIHVATTAAAVAGLALLALGRRRGGRLGVAAWLGASLEFAARRIAPGPRSAREVGAMILTSFAIPPAATFHWAVGRLRARRLLAAEAHAEREARPKAVLLDRDGTLIVDVPYNGDPDRVVPMPGARAALDRLRAAGVPLAVISNQSGVARGLITREQVDAVAERVEHLLGPIGHWLVCPHGPDDGCGCRKPAAGLVRQAAEQLGIPPAECVVIGDVGSDVEAAKAAGARAILVPTEATRPAEIGAAPEVAADLERAVDLVLGGAR
jgi:HAD superfamily hydrolase (TIGR01662 family)